MDISTVSQTSTSPTGSSAEVGGAAALTSDFNTFLQLLTTQARNQDPFNPVDATEYASQLASFSAVEQQVLTNELLTGLSLRASDGEFERLVSWIGLEARVAEAAYFDGSEITFEYEVPEDVQSAVLAIRDEEGAVRNRIALTPGDGSSLWDGRDLAGAVLPEGPYHAEIEIVQDDVQAESLPAFSYLRISEVTRAEDGVLLTLPGNAQVPASEVTAVRRPIE